jgi:predicted ATPase/class 3 adenylate cyclase
LDTPLLRPDPAHDACAQAELATELFRLWPRLGSLAQALAQLRAKGLAGGTQLYGDAARAPQPEPRLRGKRWITVLNMDLVGSSALMDQIGDEAYARLVCRYYETARRVVEAHGGHLDDPRGNDGLMAYFGFPRALVGSAERAADAALILRQTLPSQGVALRLGIAAGQVTVTSEQAFGLQVHLAARLQAQAQTNEILISQTCRTLLGEAYLCQALGEDLPLRGFKKTQPAHRLLAGPERGIRAPQPVPHHAFVGRARAWAALDQHWLWAQGGRGSGLLIQGEPGMGKSRLMQQWLHTQGKQCRALRLRCRPDLALSPLAVLSLTLQSLFASSQMERRLRRRLPPKMPVNEAAAIELLLPLLQPRTGETRLPDPGWLQRCTDWLLDWLAAAAKQRPLCLWIDDAHWLDPSTQELLFKLQARLPGLPLLVVLGQRPGSSPDALPLMGLEPLKLEGLNHAEALALLEQLAAHEQHPVEVELDELVARAEGVPLFLEEMWRAAQHSASSGGQLPARLEESLMVRLDALGPARPLALAAAVLGREFPLAWLQRVLRQPDPMWPDGALRHGVTALQHSGLLALQAGPVPHLRFRHALLCDAAYDCLLAEDKQRLHGLAAEALEQHFAGASWAHPELRARHWEAAQQAERAIAALLQASQGAASRGAHTEALGLVRRGLNLCPNLIDALSWKLRLLPLQAACHLALNGYSSPEAEACYLEALELANHRPDIALRLRLGLEACYMMRGDLVRARQLSAQLLQECDSQTDAWLSIQARWALANVCTHLGESQLALSLFDQALARYCETLHRPGTVQDPAVMCHGYAAWVRFETGQNQAAADHIEALMALLQRLNHPFSQGVGLGFAASLKLFFGDFQAAFELANQAMQTCQSSGFKVWEAHAQIMRGRARAELGELIEGLQDMEAGYRAWTGTGARLTCATYLALQVPIWLRLGHTDTASLRLAQGLEIAEDLGESYYRAELLRLQGLVQWQRGHLEQAQHSLDRALRLAVQQGKWGFSLRAAHSAACLLSHQGQWQAALALLEQHLHPLRTEASTLDLRLAEHAMQSWRAQWLPAHWPGCPWDLLPAPSTPSIPSLQSPGSVHEPTQETESPGDAVQSAGCG